LPLHATRSPILSATMVSWIISSSVPMSLTKAAVWRVRHARAVSSTMRSVDAGGLRWHTNNRPTILRRAALAVVPEDSPIQTDPVPCKAGNSTFETVEKAFAPRSLGAPGRRLPIRLESACA
jgi:hypothetical protein